MQCYDLEGFKALLRLDATLTSMMTLNDLMGQRHDELETIISNEQQELALKQESNLVLQTENSRLFNLWKDENKRRIDLENRVSPFSWVPWALTAVAASAAATLGLVLIIR